MVIKLFIVVYCCRCQSAISSTHECDQPGVYVTMATYRLSLVYISRCVPCRRNMGRKPFRFINTSMGVETSVNSKICSVLKMTPDTVTVVNTALELPIETIMDMLPGNLTFVWLLKRRDGTAIAEFNGNDHTILDSVSMLDVTTSRMANMSLGAVGNFVGSANGKGY